MSDASPGSQVDRSTELAEKRTRWAADRTYWAADRTLIAWIRTAISMIGFGIALGKSGDYLETYGNALDSYHSLQIVGIALITLGMVGVAGASIQYRRIDKRMATSGYGRVEPTPLGLVMGVLVLLIGIFGAIAIFL
jgi:putative membrane protein